ncbi:hypothetical protein Hanom_Chr07g00609421 [Helianthus anomalus]
MGEYKLWFNIARFVLEDGEINPNGERHIPTNNINVNTKEGEGQSGKNTGTFDTWVRSFKDLLVGKSIKVASHVNAFSALHGRALVARMIIVEVLKNIYAILNIICPGFGSMLRSL